MINAYILETTEKKARFIFAQTDYALYTGNYITALDIQQGKQWQIGESRPPSRLLQSAARAPFSVIKTTRDSEFKSTFQVSVCTASRYSRVLGCRALQQTLHSRLIFRCTTFQIVTVRFLFCCLIWFYYFCIIVY